MDAVLSEAALLLDEDAVVEGTGSTATTTILILVGPRSCRPNGPHHRRNRPATPVTTTTTTNAAACLLPSIFCHPRTSSLWTSRDSARGCARASGWMIS